jgi:hypothetical protein
VILAGNPLEPARLDRENWPQGSEEIQKWETVQRASRLGGLNAIVPVMARTRGHKTTEGRYDIRQGAAAFAPIVGAFGALAVTAIVVLFTVPPQHSAYRAPFIALAAGLLIVCMIGSFAGSLALAAIGAEEDPTANLVPATMFLHVSVMISVVAVLAAFEVLAAIYLPESKTLLALITATAGIVGGILTAFGPSDVWHCGPSDPEEKSHWLKTQWIQSHAQAYTWTNRLMVVSAVPAGLGIILRLAGVETTPTTASANWLVGIGFILTMAGVVLGFLRSRHPVNGIQRGLRREEAIGTTLAISLYTLLLMIFLP